MYFARRVVLTFVFAIKLRVEFAVLNRLAIFGQQKAQLQEERANEWIGGSRSLVSNRTDLPCHCVNSYCPPSAVLGSSEGRVQTGDSSEGVSGTTPIPPPLSFHGIATDENRPIGRDSMEELERRYLGRFGTVDIV
jgi:hypothetical protein